MSIKTNYTDEEIDALVSEVRQAFLAPAFEAVSLSKSAPKELVKAPGIVSGDSNAAMTNGTPATVMKGSGMDKGCMAKADDAEAPEASKSPEGSPPGVPADDEKDAPADSAPAVGAKDSSSASPATGDANQASSDPAQSGMVTPEQLHEAYSQLSDEELKAHYEAMKAVIMEKMQQGQGGSAAPADPSAPPAGPSANPGPSAGPAAPPAGPSAPPMDASAPPAAPPAGPSAPPAPPMDPNAPVAKSEKNDEEIKVLKKALADVTELLVKSLSQPQVKSVSSISELKKSEKPVLSRAQVENQLLRKAEDQNLSKRDRQLLTKFFMPDSKVSLEEVEHLLK